jgi:hypothetical protein
MRFLFSHMHRSRLVGLYLTVAFLGAALLVLASTLVIFCPKPWPARAEKEFSHESLGAA